MKFSIFFIIVLFSISKLSGQHLQKADSLIKLLDQHSLSDTTRVKILIDLGYAHPNAVQGLAYAQEALSLTEQLTSPLLQGMVLELLGTQHRLLGNRVASFDATFSALKLYQQLGIQRREAGMNMHLGEYYVIDGSYEQAIYHLTEGLNLYTSLQDLNQSAFVNINLGEAYRLANQFDSASICFQAALDYNQELKDELIQGYAIGNLGMVSNSMGKLEKAMVELQEAITILTKLGDPYSVAVYQADVGQIYIKQQQYAKAEIELLEAFQLVNEEGLKEQIRDISKMLVAFYKQQNRYEEGLKYQEIFQVYQDSLVNRENVQQLEQIKANYEIEKRETAIDHLEDQKETQEKVTYGFASGSSLLTLLAIGLIWSYRKLSQRKQLIEQREEEKALLLKELNHRVKNNLQMISSLLNLQSRQFEGHPAKTALTAGKLRVEAMSLIHQKLYQDNHQTQIPIRNYVEELVQNLQSAYSQSTKLNFQIQDIQLDVSTAIPLALIVNELVINAFKYAFEGIENPKLTVQVTEEQESIALLIADNGIGMEGIDWKNTTSFGLKLVHSLVRQLGGKVYMTGEKGSQWHIKLKNRK